MLLVILSGGVAGPVLLMLGLVSTPASSAALLLNLEGLATMAIAWAVFKENVDRRLLLGALAILRSEEHTSELQSLMRISYAVFCLKKKKQTHYHNLREKTDDHKAAY